MAEEVGKGVVKIEADAKGLGKDVDKQISAEGRTLNDSGSKFGMSWGKAFKIAAGSAAITGFIAIAGDAIGAASDLAESANAVNVTFGEAADGITKLGKDAATAVGLSTTEFNSLAVRFSSFASTIAGDGGDVVSTMDEMTTRAADFASVMNLDVSRAAELFQSGLAGESEPLKQFGIDLSAAAVEAFAAANGIGTLGEELTEAEKVQARYGLLMEKTNKSAGDFANTSDGLANRQRIMAAQFENVKAKIGTALLPAMAAAVGFITNQVIPAFITVRDAIAAAFDWIGENKALVIAAFSGFAIVVITAVVPAFVAWAVAAGAAAVATIAATAPVIAIGLAAAALTAGIIWLYQNVDVFRNSVNAVRDFIVDHVVPAFQMIVGIIQDHVVPVVKLLIEIYIKALVVQFKAIKAVIMDVVVPAIQAIVGFIRDVLVPAIVWIIDTGLFPLRVAFGAVQSVVTDHVMPVLAALASFFTGVFNVAAAAARTIIDALSTAFSTVAGWAQKLWDTLEPVRAFLAGAFAAGVGIATGALGKIVDALEAIINAAKTAKSWIDKVKGADPAGGIGRLGGEPIGGNAAGGFMAPNSWSFVGERGPELMRAGPRGATVVNSSMSMATLGIVAGQSQANQFPDHLTLMIEGKPFTAIVMNRERELVGALRAGARG